MPPKRPPRPPSRDSHDIVFGGVPSDHDSDSNSGYGGGYTSDSSVEAAPRASPLDPLPLDASSLWPFCPLLSATTPVSSTAASSCVISELLATQRCVVKTIKDDEHCWSSLTKRLSSCVSFHTSTSLLPPNGRWMKLYGSLKEFPCGLLFELPEDVADEGSRPNALDPPNVYAWNSGYSAKTEFNMDSRGNLVNGRKEALTTIAELRVANAGYAEAIGGEELRGRVFINFATISNVMKPPSLLVAAESPYTLLSTPPRTVDWNYVPFNEVFVRVGGNAAAPSLESGLGRPIALFARHNSYFHLVALLRAQARFSPHVPRLLLLDPENGAVAISDEARYSLLRTLATSVNPWLSHLSEQAVLSLTDDVKDALSLTECAALAGGFGTDNEDIR